VHRWLDDAGQTAQASIAGQLRGIAQTQVVGTDGLWAKLKDAPNASCSGGGQRQRWVYRPCGEGEESAGPWQRVFARAQQAGLDLDALRGVTRMAPGVTGLFRMA